MCEKCEKVDELSRRLNSGEPVTEELALEVVTAILIQMQHPLTEAVDVLGNRDAWNGDCALELLKVANTLENVAVAAAGNALTVRRLARTLRSKKAKLS